MFERGKARRQSEILWSLERSPEDAIRSGAHDDARSLTRVTDPWSPEESGEVQTL
jgi:hypothetical protein